LAQVDLETQNQLNRLDGLISYSGDAESSRWDEKRVKEEIVYTELQREVEAKVNERRVRRHDLEVVRARLEEGVAWRVAERVKDIREGEMEKRRRTIQSMQYGIANKELKPLAEAYDLEGMKAIIDYTANY
jgi:hypothetical protein